MISRRVTGWSAVALLVVASALLDPTLHEERASTRPWLGPLAELASSVQWIRFQRAHLRGEEARALVLARSALELSPRSTDGWRCLASHLGLFLASPTREGDLERRRAFFRAALETLHEGVERAAEPEELQLFRGLLLLNKADLDPSVSPDGEGGLLREAERAFREARRAGHPDAVDFERFIGERYASEPSKE